MIRHTIGALVTGVQTCALPICPRIARGRVLRGRVGHMWRGSWRGGKVRAGRARIPPGTLATRRWLCADCGSAWKKDPEIGRAACRERVCRYVQITVVADVIKKKTKSHIPNL